MKTHAACLLAALLAACGGELSKEPPLAPLNGEPVFLVEIDGYMRGQPKKRCSFTDPKSVAYVTDRLVDLEARLYSHSMPEFNVRLASTSGRTVILRVSEHEVGPDAPASGFNTHWFPKNRELYDFLKERTYGQCEVRV